jgi:hypothetical protein
LKRIQIHKIHSSPLQMWPTTPLTHCLCLCPFGNLRVLGFPLLTFLSFNAMHLHFPNNFFSTSICSFINPFTTFFNMSNVSFSSHGYFCYSKKIFVFSSKTLPHDFDLMQHVITSWERERVITSYTKKIKSKSVVSLMDWTIGIFKSNIMAIRLFVIAIVEIY